LVVPIAVQTVLGGLTVPFQAQLRGYRRGGALFLQQLVQAVSLLIGAGVGLALGGVLGLAWGMAAATVVALATMAMATSRLSVAPVGAGDAVPGRLSSGTVAS
jgi:hypothetical protein